MATFRQGDWAKAEPYQNLSQRVRVDQELVVAGLHCLMLQKRVTSQNSVLLVAGRILCLHRPVLNLTYYLGK